MSKQLDRWTRTILVSFFAIAGMCSYACAQALIMTSPFGRPTAVRDEADNWSTPISVYSDSEVEIFAPDITSSVWASWHSAHFRETGTYPISLYSYYKTESACRREMIPAGHSTDPDWLQACSELRYRLQHVIVDTRKKTITIVQTILMNGDASYHPEYSFPAKITVTFSSARESLAKAVASASAIVTRETSEHHAR